MSDEDAYGGALGAFPYAFRASDSWAFRGYVVLAAVVAAGSLAFFLLALVGWIAATANQSASVAVSRAFLLVVWLGVALPTVAPVLLVARRYRTGRAADPRYDPALALSGYLFVAGLYAGLLASVPAEMQEPPSGVLAPAVSVLYGLPQLAGLLPPAAAAALIWATHRYLG